MQDTDTNETNTSENETKPIETASPITDNPTPDTAQPIASAVKTHSGTTPKKFQITGKRLVIFGLILVLSGCGAGVAYLQFKSEQPAASMNATQSTSTTTKRNTSASGQQPAQAVATTTVCNGKSGTATQAAWTGERQKLDDLQLFSSPPVEGSDYTIVFTYYQVGTTADKLPIILVIGEENTMAESTAILIKDSASHYSLIDANSYFKDSDGKLRYTPSGSITIDTKRYLPDICPSANLLYQGATIRASFLPVTPVANATFASKIADNSLHTYPNGTLHEYIYRNEPLYTTAYMMFGLPDTRLVHMEFVGPLDTQQPALSATYSSDYVQPITWSDGSKNTEQYATKQRGCGAYGAYEIAKGIQQSDLQQIGTGPDDTPVYTFASINNPLLQLHYTEYRSDFDGSFQQTGVTANLSATDWIKTRPLLIVKDQLGRYLVYISTEYNLGGCGKPVVYLYPTKTTKVTVRVDAHVNISEPAYDDRNGWTVSAEPSGRLTWNNKHYSSLYWEGTGKGLYPMITSGTVVGQSQLRQTLYRQMTRLGLNRQEQADFMDFWSAKLPATPYVRLTWFGTQQMEQLAPLHITPKPDSLVRVFLDFEGLDRPVNLPPQVLPTYSRKGFTVVEWGGLLAGGIHN